MPLSTLEYMELDNLLSKFTRAVKRKYVLGDMEAAASFIETFDELAELLPQKDRLKRGMLQILK